MGYNTEIVAKQMRDRGIVSPLKSRDIKRVTRELYRDEGLVAAVRFYRAALYEQGGDPGLKTSIDMIREKWGPMK